jgi:hypothetical protein
MLFKINSILFKVAILLCIIYCSGSFITAYNKLDRQVNRDNVIVTQASFQPIFINLWGIKR